MMVSIPASTPLMSLVHQQLLLAHPALLFYPQFASPFGNAVTIPPPPTVKRMAVLPYSMPATLPTQLSLKRGPVSSPPYCPAVEVPQRKRARHTPSPDRQTQSPLPALGGEHRLIIDFVNYGGQGTHPQSFGKSNVLIPDGLVARHTVYQQPWEVRIQHGQVVSQPNTAQDEETAPRVFITYTLTNLESGESCSRTETESEVIMRCTTGRTILNKIVRTALEQRVLGLSRELEGEVSDVRRANVVALIKVLQPERVTQGPLVFGLQHRIVQEHIGNPHVVSSVVS